VNSFFLWDNFYLKFEHVNAFKAKGCRGIDKYHSNENDQLSFLKEVDAT
jgi:hypothetical protein